MGLVVKTLVMSRISGVFSWMLAAVILSPFGVPLGVALFFAGAGAGAAPVSYVQRRRGAALRRDAAEAMQARPEDEKAA